MALVDPLARLDRRFGCVLVSSPQGHSGKTIVTVGLCDAFRRRGLSVAPFKKGPDYIDPSWLTVAGGRSCRNLDLFLMPEDRLLASFERACRGADLAVIEGAMGLYDGFDSAGRGTSAELARFLNCPILLVVNTARMTGSIAAMVTGYQHFQPDTPIAGVILNHISGKRHEQKLKTAVERYCQIPVVGSIPKDIEFHIEERHLGLIPSPESEESESVVERIGRKLESHLEIDQILALAERAQRPVRRGSKREEKGQDRREGTVKIGVILDRVFNFYYPENLEALIDAGAELIYVNSLQDRLPEIEGLYIGGGFPEFFLKELEENRGLRGDIAEAIENGLPVYAECAGLMYLCQRISWQDRSYEMVGIIPAEVHLSLKPQGHGYVIAEVKGENPFFPQGLVMRGHEFHHSSVSFTESLRFTYQIKRGQGIDGKRDGIVYKNMLASYTHLHALGVPEWAEGFVSLASKQAINKEESKEFRPTLSRVS